MTAEIEPAPTGRALAPLIVGVTGKLDLAGADEAVRAALELMFDRLDARCPHSPKVLLSALARGADTVAAKAALARAGWEVVAPLPMSVAHYLDDFDDAEAHELHALLAHPKVRTLILGPLRTAHRGPHIPETDLIREPGVSNLARKDHYEQAGLFIAERAAILVAVMQEDEPPGKVGGTARILRHRLTGELDASSADIVRRSDCLVEPPRLDDRLTGPAWIVDLGRLGAAPNDPAGALRVWTPGAPGPAPQSDATALAESLAMAESLDTLNAQIAGLPEADWTLVERSAGPDAGDAASRLRRVQAGISTVQSQMNRRIRRRVWLLAGLFCAAVLSFEVYSDLSMYPVTSAASALYVACVLAAVVIYSHASRRKWQRLAEDYRAAAEALRVQLVWWDSGLTGREHAITHFYLRGARGPFKLLKIWINQLIDGAVLRCAPPVTRPDAADEWIAGQIAFFDVRIAARRASIRFVEGSGWVLFALSLGAAVCLVVMQVTSPGLWMAPMHLAPANRVILLIAGLSLIGWLFLDTARAPLQEHDGEEPPAAATRPDWINGLMAGLVLTATLCDLATLMPPAGEPDMDLAAMFNLAKELVSMAVIIPAALAGAIRFVAEKLSWDSELTGYVHTRENFRRGQISLARAEAGGADAEEERRHLLRALGGEALGENEAWLRAHRQRPLEPVVGG